MVKRGEGSRVDSIVFLFCIATVLVGIFLFLVERGFITGHDVSTPQCLDSDGGINYGKQGTVSLAGGGTNTDGCPSSTSLYEYYCNTDDQVLFQTYTCPQGCSNGVCTGVLPSKGTLSVIVSRAGTGAGITNAQVQIEQGTSVLTTAPSSNVYRFTDAPAGLYTLSVSAPGFSSHREQNVLVPSDTSRAHDVSLVPFSGNATWKFDEASWQAGSASVFDSLGNSPGIPQGGVTTVSQGVGGRAAYFDGVDDVVSVNNYQIASTGGPVSVQFWMRVNASETKDGGVFGVGIGDTHRFNAYLWGNQMLYWDYGNPDPAQGRISVNYAHYYGNWTHVALVSRGNGGNLKEIYLNGKLAAASEISDGPDVSLSGLTLGVSKDTYIVAGVATTRINYLKGILDEINITFRVIGADEIKSTYERQRGELASTGGLGLMAEWKFEDAVSADVGGIRDTFGAVSGTAKGGASSSAGKVGKSLMLDGVDDEVVFTNNNLLSVRGPMSVSGWFKANNLSTGNVLASWASKRDAFVFGPHADGSVSFHVYVSSDGGNMYRWVNATARTGSVKEGVWQYWSAVYNGSEVLLYLNGSEVAKSSASGVLALGRDFYIGHDFITGSAERRFFNGAIDELQLYDRGLSSAEVDALYKVQLSLATTTPVPPSTLSACGTIDQPGVYVLSRSLSAPHTCLTIAAENVVVDGQGNTVRVSATTLDPLAPSPITTGIVIRDKKNINLKNIRVEGFTTGVLLHRAHNATLESVSISQSEEVGLHINETRDAYVRGGSIEQSFGTGVIFSRSNNTFMNRVAVRSHARYGVFFTKGSTNNTLIRMTFSNNGFNDFLEDPLDPMTKNNTVTLAGDSENRDPQTPLIVQPTLLARGYNTTLGLRETLLFRVGNTTHNLTITNITSTSVSVQIRSNPIAITLTTGQTQAVDLNANNRPDFSITLMRIVGGKATLTLRTIAEPLSSDDGGGIGGKKNTDSGGTNTGSGTTLITNTTNSTKLGGKQGWAQWDKQTMIIVIVALVIFIIFVVVAIAYVVRQQNPARNNEFYRPEPHSSTLQPGGMPPGF